MSNIIRITSLRKNLYDIVRIVTENGVQTPLEDTIPEDKIMW